MTHTGIPTITLPSGESVARLGQGTWQMGEDRRRQAAEVEALRLGIDLGLTVIDTAELYDDGGAEEVVGQAIAGRRDQVFLVTKVLPHNATRQGTVAACERSLRRLGTDRIDLYLLHWRGNPPLAETLAGFEALVAAGKIRYWGVSNLDPAEMTELARLPGGGAVAANQVLYNLLRRGIEYDLLPWCREQAVPVMAYSPLEQGRLLPHPLLRDLAADYDATPAQIALAWLLHQPGVMVIPKAARVDHVRENRAAADLVLRPDDLALLNQVFPPPHQAVPLEML